MANTVIQLKHSTLTGNVPSSLANGEVSINNHDGKFFYSTPAGVVVTHFPFSGPAGLNQEIQFNDSGVLGSDSGLTYNKTTDVITVVGGAIVDGVNVTPQIQLAFTQANTPSHIANSAASYANSAFSTANGALGAAAASSYANSAFIHANSAFVAANASNGTVQSVSYTGGLISVANSTTTAELTVSGTSGGIPFFSSASTWATSGVLANNALVVGGGAGAQPSTVTTGTGVITALGVNTGLTGAVVVNGGQLGTPSSGIVTNLTGTASININGTVGATTPTTAAVTKIDISAGTTSIAPIDLAAGVVLTTPLAGAFEYDTTNTLLFFTGNITNGRGILPATQYLRLTANGVNTATTISPFFGTNSSIPLVANGVYEIEIECYYIKNSNGTLIWTLTNSAVVTNMTVNILTSPIAGHTNVPTASTTQMGALVQQTAAATAFAATGTVANNATMWSRFKIILENASSTSIRLNVTNSAGNITPRRGSFWKATRIADAGTYAA